MRKYILLSFCFFIFYSCLYKAGNRQQDINFIWQTSVSPFFIKEHMESLDSFYANRSIITSEIVNYPETFIPVTNSIFGYKYVIEFNNLDTMRSLELNYFGLASIYDFKKGKWVTDRDSLNNNELEIFRRFFEDSVLTKVAQRFRNIIPDSLLFIGNPDSLYIKPLE